MFIVYLMTKSNKIEKFIFCVISPLIYLKINNFRRLRLQMTTWRVTKDLYKYLKLIADTVYEK
jgi:hypothetical protein